MDPRRRLVHRHALLAVWGESAGGHLAALLALVTDPELIGTDGVGSGDTSIQAVVDFYDVADPRTMPSFFDAFPPHILAQLTAGDELNDVLLDTSTYPREEAEHLAAPVAHVTASAPPFLLIHGEEDGAVPIAQSAGRHAALVGAGAESELVRVPGADHIFLGTDPEPQFARALEFLTARLA